MAGIIRVTEKVDSYNRVTLPKEWCSKGELVFFELTKTGNLIVRKMKTEKEDKELPSNL